VALVELAIANGIAWLTLNRPEKLNVLDRATVAELAARLDELKHRLDVRVVVTRGAGRAYCAGSDLADLAALPPDEAANAERAHGEAAALLDALPQPAIAQIHGYALGGGLGLALYHDFRFAADSSVLGMPEVELGWTPPWAMGRLVDVVGPNNARWLAMGCVRVSGVEAKSLGLVNEIAPADDLTNRVETFAGRLAAMPPAGLRETKALLNQMAPLRRPEWDDTAAAAFARCFAEPEARANVAAFLARRRAGRKLEARIQNSEGER
jgi:enoyl-CoA hydratase/carnithine racemase